MPNYKVEKPFWRHGRLVEVGEKIFMTEAEAKYLGHVLSKSKPEVQLRQIASQPAPAVPSESTPLAVSVVEDKPARSIKRRQDVGHGDSAN